MKYVAPISWSRFVAAEVGLVFSLVEQGKIE